MAVSITQLLIVVFLVVLLFGTKKLSSLGSDLGASIKGFKKAINDDDEPKKKQDADFSTSVLPDNHTDTASNLAKKQDQDKKQV